MLAPFPAPDQTILGILDLANPYEPALCQNPRRRPIHTKRVCPNPRNLTTFERPGKNGLHRFGGESSSLVAGYNPIPDLNHPRIVRRLAEPDAPNYQLTVAVNNSKTM